MEKPDYQKQGRYILLVKMLRMAGLFLMALGALIFVDASGLASRAQLTEGGLHQILGGMLFLMGLVDVVLMPRIFETLFQLGRK